MKTGLSQASCWMSNGNLQSSMPLLNSEYFLFLSYRFYV